MLLGVLWRLVSRALLPRARPRGLPVRDPLENPPDHRRRLLVDLVVERPLGGLGLRRRVVGSRLR